MKIKPWLLVEGIADYLGVSQKTIYHWTECKKISTLHICKLRKLEPSEMNQLVMLSSAMALDGKQGR